MSVIDRLRKHILVDGFHVVVDLEKSEGSWIRDAESNALYLDCYSQFASQPFGWNYLPFLRKDTERLRNIAMYKLANSDMYSEVYADFVDTFASITPDFKHYFFVEGGTFGVENALKAAFDWKCQVDPQHQVDDGQRLDVIHLKEAFHGRSGYSLSLTNSGELKTKWFPKFKWTRVLNPKFGRMDSVLEIEHAEMTALEQMETALKTGNVAAIIMETIQGEGGDNHFRHEFFKEVRVLADKYNAMLIFDEVQCGMGLTGKWWAYEHMGVKPDMMCFGKKTQVCGFCANERIEQAKENVFVKSGRINSTWGGNFVDMERARIIIEVMKERNLVAHAEKVGAYFLAQMLALGIPEMINIRGRGLMLAFDLPTPERRDEVLFNLHEKGLLALKCGTKTIRFRPALTFSEQDVDDAVYFIKQTLS
jgi:L-lysine 6-transaminase